MLSPVGRLGGSFGLVFVTVGLNTKLNDTYCASKESKRELLSLFLKEESKQTIDKYLAKRGQRNLKSNFVCFGNSVSEETLFVFKPLFGERAAFRLKGIIETNDGDVVGVGRISTMIGEIKHDEFEVSLPLIANNSKNTVQALIDLPTRLMKTESGSKTFWKGRIPPGEVEGRRYPAIGASYTSLSIDRQIIVDGFICSDSYVDESGNCSFDRATEIVPVSDQPSPVEVVEKVDGPSNTPVDSSTSADQSGNSVDVEECPVCRYMKAGPCKEKFVSWDECVTGVKTDEDLTKCFQVTADMMSCMKVHEHYDIMTAGMDFSKVDGSGGDGVANKSA